MLVCLPLSAKETKIVQDNFGQLIKASFDENGIINQITGTVSEYSVENLNIDISGNRVKVHTQYSGDGCYNIELVVLKNHLQLTKFFTENNVFKYREDLTYNIYFEDNDDYFIKDDFVTIKKDEIKSEIPVSHSDSYLPMLKYKDNICIQYFGKNMPKIFLSSWEY